MMSTESRSVDVSTQNRHIASLAQAAMDALSALQAALPENVDIVTFSAADTPIILPRAQQALRVSEERYRRLIPRLAALIFELTADGTTLFINEMVTKITGYQLQELIGRNLWSVLCPEGAGALQRKLLAGDVTNYELLLTAKDGTKITLDFTSANRYRPDGRLERVVGLGMDNSKSKGRQDQDERTDEENRLRAMLRYSSDNISIINDAGTVLYISPSIERILGYTPQDLTGQSIIEFIHPDDIEEANQVIARLIAQRGEWFTMEVRARHKTGDWRILEISATNLFSDPAVRGIVANAHDITVRRQAEKTRLSLATIVEASGDTIVTETFNGRFTSWNSGAENAFGYTAEEAIGKPPSILTPPTFPDDSQIFLERLRKGEVIRQQETICQRKDGTLIYVSLTVLPIRDATGSIVGAAAVGHDVTKQRKHQDDLRLLGQIVETSDDAIILKSVDGTILSWNKGAEKIYGYTSEEIIGKSIALITPLDRADDFASIVRKLRQGESVEHYETVRRRKDGAEITISLSTAVFRNTDGEMIGISGIERDVTTRKQSDEKIYFQARLLDTAGQAIIASDLQGNVIYWNRFAEILYQWPHSDQVQHNVIELVPHEESSEKTLDLRANIAKGGSWTSEFNAKRADGSIFPAVTTNSLLYNDEGRLIGIIGVSSDISDRKQTEEVLRHQTLRLENQHKIDDAILSARSLQEISHTVVQQIITVIGCTGGSVALMDLENREFMFYVNSSTDQSAFSQGSRVRFEDISNADRDVEMLSQGEIILVPDARLLPPSPAKDLMLAEGIRSSLVIPLMDRLSLIGALSLSDKRVGYFSNQDLDFVREAASSLAVAIVQLRLLNENMKLFEQMQKLNAELEQRVLDRTAELELANQELEAFSYSISHDLRSPLRAIDGFSRIVLRDYALQLPADGQRRLQAIRSNAQHMGDLIDDLLNFSRLSRQALHRHQLATEDIVKQVLEGLANEFEGRKVELTIGNLPVLYGDPSLIAQVFINLISNALKYTRTREIARIEIGHTFINEKSTYFIKDNGVGFDMIYADKLFGVFQRLHDPEEFEGTGVGLAIVQRIIRRHGGQVWAEAEIDRGATFYFTIEGEEHDVRK